MRAFVLILIVNGQAHATDGVYETEEECAEAAVVKKFDIDKQKLKVRTATICGTTFVVVIN